jgi:DNA-nicking Smr family endonuclease
MAYYQGSDFGFKFKHEAKFDFHDLELKGITDYEVETHLFHFLEDSYHKGLQNVLVVTGKGSVIKPMVLKLLKTSSQIKNLVKRYKLAGYFNGQGGALEIVLKG